MCVCVCVCVRACVCACMRACVRVCVCVGYVTICNFLYGHAHTFMHTHVLLCEGVYGVQVDCHCPAVPVAVVSGSQHTRSTGGTGYRAG